MTPTPSHVATDELIETLERLEKEATPGPWTVDRTATRRKETCAILSGNNRRIADTLNADEVEIYEEDGDWFDVQGDRNFKLIAALRNHLPALISALKENKRLREDVKVAQYQAWETAIRCASNTVGLFPNDTKESLHRFGAETVLRALLHVRAQCLDTAALQPQGEK